MTNNKKFNFPNNLLKQLDECSFGGYVLFNFNQNGDPQVYTKFDNQVNAMALFYYLGSWASTVDQMNMDATADAINKENKKHKRNDQDSQDDNDNE